jgi:stearoyl-CoA 9-desaturase NADPH oxidoreductase
VAFVHLCRHPDEQIFADALRTLTAQMPGLQTALHFSAVTGRFGLADLHTRVPDVAERATWACGPASLLDTLQTHWQSAAIPAPLHTERFAAAPLALAPLSAPVRVEFRRGAKAFESLGSASLLDQAEAAGLAPKHGCRIGICRSCQCVKRSGTVQNLQTGELSSEPDELIRLCISAARTDLTLEL